MFLKRIIFSMLIMIAIQSILVSPVWAIKKRLQSTHAQRLSMLTNDPLERADFLNDGWLHDKALAWLDSSGRDDSEILWRQARSIINQGENLPESQAFEYYKRALELVELAVEKDAQNPQAQEVLAVSCGRVALFKGVFKSIGLVKRVHAAAHLAIALGDSMPVSLYILGKTHKKLIEKPDLLLKALGLGWVRADSVSYYFDKAIEVSHDNMVQCLYEYADFQFREHKEKEIAIRMLNRALELPLRDEQDRNAKKMATELLLEISGEK